MMYWISIGTGSFVSGVHFHSRAKQDIEKLSGFVPANMIAGIRKRSEFGKTTELTIPGNIERPVTASRYAVEAIDSDGCTLTRKTFVIGDGVNVEEAARLMVSTNLGSECRVLKITKRTDGDALEDGIWNRNPETGEYGPQVRNFRCYLIAVHKDGSKEVVGQSGENRINEGIAWYTNKHGAEYIKAEGIRFVTEPVA